MTIKAQKTFKKNSGFTIIEVIVTVIVLAILASLTMVIYWKIQEKAKNAEAYPNMHTIRTAEFLKRAEGDTFVNASNTDEINKLLGIQISENLFTYKVINATATDFKIIATRLGALMEEAAGPFTIIMGPSGETSTDTPPPPSTDDGGESDDDGGSGGGGGSGGSGGGGSGGGSSGGGGGSGGSGGGSSGGGGGSSSGGGSGSSNSGSGAASGEDERPFEFIEQDPSVWTAWPDENTVNISGTGSAALLAAFNFAAATEASSITDDLTAKGISITFAGDEIFDRETGLCGGTVACFAYGTGFVGQVPGPPDPLPVIYFNDDYIDESVESLAMVLIHEGTHFQQYLDLSAGSEGTEDIEFEAFWNAAVIWGDIRSDVGTYTSLEEQEEHFYLLAHESEASLRAEIRILYARQIAAES